MTPRCLPLVCLHSQGGGIGGDSSVSVGTYSANQVQPATAAGGDAQAKATTPSGGDHQKPKGVSHQGTDRHIRQQIGSSSTVGPHLCCLSVCLAVVCVCAAADVCPSPRGPAG